MTDISDIIFLRFHNIIRDELYYQVSFKTQDKVFWNSYAQINNEIMLRVHVQVNRNILSNITLKNIK